MDGPTHSTGQIVPDSVTLRFAIAAPPSAKSRRSSSDAPCGQAPRGKLAPIGTEADGNDRFLVLDGRQDRTVCTSVRRSVAYSAPPLVQRMKKGSGPFSGLLFFWPSVHPRPWPWLSASSTLKVPAQTTRLRRPERACEALATASGTCDMACQNQMGRAVKAKIRR